jgi:hypothetical protein
MLKGFFGDKGDKGTTESTDADAELEAALKDVVAKTPKSISIPLTVPVKYTSVAPMALDDKRLARARCVASQLAKVAT